MYRGEMYTVGNDFFENTGLGGQIGENLTLISALRIMDSLVKRV